MNTPYRPNGERVFFGFLLAPVAGAVAYVGFLAILGVLAGASGHGSGGVSLFDGVAAIFLFALAFAVGSTLILGLPAYFAIRRRDRLTFLNVVVAGGFLGWAPSLLFTGHHLWYLATRHPWDRSIVSALIGPLEHWGLAFVSGAAGGLTFWGYVVRKDPDYSHQVRS